MMRTTDQIGGLVARDVWQWVADCEAIELVPWVSDPKSDKYDPIKTAEHAGWKRALKELESLINESSARHGNTRST